MTSSRVSNLHSTWRKASELILGYYQSKGLRVETKKDHSPVTVADREAEALIRTNIVREFPGDGAMGEELGTFPSSNGFNWILDPVDGTKSFIHGVPLFGTLIGLEYEKRLVIGVCRFPVLNEVVYAQSGKGPGGRAATATSSRPACPR